MISNNNYNLKLISESSDEIEILPVSISIEGGNIPAGGGVETLEVSSEDRSAIRVYTSAKLRVGVAHERQKTNSNATS